MHAMKARGVGNYLFFVLALYGGESSAPSPGRLYPKTNIADSVCTPT